MTEDARRHRGRQAALRLQRRAWLPDDQVLQPAEPRRRGLRRRPVPRPAPGLRRERAQDVALSLFIGRVVVSCLILYVEVVTDEVAQIKEF